MEQLKDAAQAVFRSWMSDRACTYRKLEHLEHLQGTAVTVQAMVFGNAGLSSRRRRGVFARSFDRLSQAGDRRAVRYRKAKTSCPGTIIPTPKQPSPDRFPRSRRNCAKRWRGSNKISAICRTSNSPSRTASSGSCRRARRNARRGPRCASRSTSSRKAASRRRKPCSVSNGLHLRSARHQAAGRRASRSGAVSAHRPGVAVGRAAFDSDSAARLAASGDPVILVRPDTTTADVGGFAVSAGIVTAIGGRTAHAALVARQMGKTLRRRLRRACRRCRRSLRAACRQPRSKKAIGSRSTAKRERSIAAEAKSSRERPEASSPKSSAGVTACAAPLPRPRELSPFFRMRSARGRVGRIFSCRLTRLMRFQIDVAVATACSSDNLRVAVEIGFRIGESGAAQASESA